jgi:hypothetical protein
LVARHPAGVPLHPDLLLRSARSRTYFALRRGTFISLVALQDAINRFVAKHHREPKPLAWTADPDAIAGTVQREYHASRSMARPVA